MEHSTAPDQTKTRRTPEEIRAERIKAVSDPEVRRDIEETLKARDAKLAELREIQKRDYEKHTAEILEQRKLSSNGPQLTPPGMKDIPNLDASDQRRAILDAKAEVLRQYQGWDRSAVVPYNRQIDRKLDEHERTRAAGEERQQDQRHSQEPRRLVKFEDRFPEAARREITR